jgi:hypothetical protein
MSAFGIDRCTCWARRIATASLTSLFVASLAGASPVVIVPTDGPGEGFNDTTPVAPVGGNPGTTLGEQRANAYERAGALIGDRLGNDDVTVVVEAKFDPLQCSGSSAILGQAGPAVTLRDFPGAPLASTWYPIALANQISSSDQSPNGPDIVATFSSTLEEPDCFGDAGFYYGFDGNATGGNIDFLSVLLHELSHGLGFASGVNPFSGAKLSGLNDVFMIHMRDESVGLNFPAMTDPQRMAAIINTGNLVWSGTNVNAAAVPPFLSTSLIGGIGPNDQVLLYAPDPVVPGSSQSHYDVSVEPNQLMEPIYSGPNHNLDLTFELMKDLGYPSIIDCGDGTRDGAVTASDALLTLQSAVGTGACLESLCDPDSTGTVTATDALIILKAAVGQAIELSCGLS